MKLKLHDILVSIAWIFLMIFVAISIIIIVPIVILLHILDAIDVELRVKKK